MNHLTAGKAAAAGVALACALLFEPHVTALAPPQATAPAAPAAAGGTSPPTAENSVRFAVLGDTGTGDRPQYEVAAQLEKSRAIFPFEFVIMVGDNMYGAERPQDYVRKFELPYKPMLDAKVQFFASLGNHDDPNQRFYKPFNMNGERYYTFKFGNPGVRFFALDSNYMARASQVVGKGVGELGFTVENCVLPSPALLVGRPSRVGPRSSRAARAALPEAWGECRLRRSRALLRAPSPAKGHRLLHGRWLRKTPRREHPEGNAHRRRVRHQSFVHARRSRGRRHALPNPLANR